MSDNVDPQGYQMFTDDQTYQEWINYAINWSPNSSPRTANMTVPPNMGAPANMTVPADMRAPLNPVYANMGFTANSQDLDLSGPPTGSGIPYGADRNFAANNVNSANAIMGRAVNRASNKRVMKPSTNTRNRAHGLSNQIINNISNINPDHFANYAQSGLNALPRGNPTDSWVAGSAFDKELENSNAFDQPPQPIIADQGNASMYGQILQVPTRSIPVAQNLLHEADHRLTASMSARQAPDGNASPMPASQGQIRMTQNEVINNYPTPPHFPASDYPDPNASAENVPELTSSPTSSADDNSGRNCDSDSESEDDVGDSGYGPETDAAMDDAPCPQTPADNTQKPSVSQIDDATSAVRGIPDLSTTLNLDGQLPMDQPVSNTFNSLEEARAHHRRFKAVEADSTIPTTSADKLFAIRKIKEVIHSTKYAFDSPKVVESFSNTYTDEYIELVAWSLLERMLDIHVYGDQISVQRMTPAAEKKENKVKVTPVTFHDRLEAVLHSLAKSKSICKHLLDQLYIDQFVQAPEAAFKRVQSNKRVNDRKSEQIRLGRTIAEFDPSLLEAVKEMNQLKKQA